MFTKPRMTMVYFSYHRNEGKDDLMVLIIILVLLFLLLFLGGMYHLARALWEFRRGENRNAFVLRAMVGSLLVVLSFLAPWLMLMVGSMSVIHQTAVLHSLG
jgi:uncharacterized membrane protein YidH (DUF202 family)